jgi:hypothetical protein
MLLAAGLSAFCALASCSEDGVTPTCPALPRYQTFALGDASAPDAMSSTSAESKAELAAAIEAGCATAPIPVAVGGATSSAGGTSGGAGGSGGKAGSGGKSGGGSGGLSSTDNAGAAGRN